MKKFLLILIAVLLSLCSCELYEYGRLGGADQTNILKPGGDGTRAEFAERMSFMSGVWYSHYAGIGRLDGYRVGKWADFGKLVADSGKIALFPEFEPVIYTTGKTPLDDDYFVFYDDTVYGQNDDGIGGNEGWDGMIFRYIGIARAVNIFNGDPDRGAVIIEYLKGCAPAWDDDIKDGQRPFFGIYYRVLKPDVVQMANAVDLAALYNGEKYYTETVTLDEAVALNTVENEAEFIAWGVVIPQDREK
ncbi:MAG: hypothetical protein LBF77_11400 [Spirochaetaceae bacterium]|jgi:hypothetical protein|nr:hypothetical protein [Spirochaetaceae bacterium]